MSRPEYSIRSLLEINACTNCRICAEVCPAVEAAGEGKLSGVHRISELKKNLRSRTAFWQRIFRFKEPSNSQWTEFSQSVFRCTLCGNCQELCPAGIHLKDIWLELRRDLNQSHHYPEKIDVIRENLAETHNVFEEDNDERADWIEECEEEPEEGFLARTAETVYFTGCVASFYPVAQQIPVSLATIFQEAGIHFAILGSDEWCCGFPLLSAGLFDHARKLIEHNLEAISQRDARRVVFSCPSCYQMWREYYPYHGKFEIFHTTSFLLDLVRREKLKFAELPLKVTYHDPCDLGRGAREFENPRSLIGSIPGIELVELERNRENCRCCGGGGSLEMIDPDLSGKITELKIREILATGAQAVVTSCQQCVRTMTTWVRRNDVPLQVFDVARLVRKALRE